MKTVGDIKKMLADTIAGDNVHHTVHASDMLEPRNDSRSVTELGLKDVPDRTVLLRAYGPVDKGQTQVYRFNYEMVGKIGCVSLAEVLTANEMARLSSRGDNAGELVIHEGVVSDDRRESRAIYVVVGMLQYGHRPAKGEGPIRTVLDWHPGRPLLRLDDGVCGDTAVFLE